MKTAGWVGAVVLAMAAVLGGFWYGMVHAKQRVAATPPVAAAAEARVDAGSPQVAPTAAQLAQLASVACGQAVKVGPKDAMTCPVCPRGSDDGGDGVQPDSNWQYDSVVFGHFTAAGADEALLRSSGCESDADTFGGDFLLRRDAAGAWQRVRYIQGGEASGRCQPLRWTGTQAMAGRDALVCDVGAMHQGVQFDSVRLMTVDATAQAPGGGEHTEFLSIDDYSADCPPEGERRSEQVGAIDKINLLPGGPDGQDVEILASVGRAPIPASVKPGDDCPKVPEQHYRLLFRNAGDHFVAADGYAAMKALAQSGAEGDITVSDRVTPFAY